MHDRRWTAAKSALPALYYRQPAKSSSYIPAKGTVDSRSRAFTKLPYTYETIPSLAYVAKKVRGNPCVAIYLSNTI